MKNKKLLPLLLLGGILSTWGAHAKKTESPIRTISVDYQQVKGPLNDFFRQCVGAGRAGEGLRADWQQQLLEIKKDCNFQRIRFHALFHDEMGVYREEADGPHYNWQYIDMLYDYLIKIGVKPFVELAFMPEQMSSSNKTIFWWKGNVTPPKDYNKWEQLVKNFALHLKERYGEQEVATWYFEVWNEPNLDGFFKGTQQDYFKLYQHSASGIKAASPRFRIGGPATAGCAWIPELMNFCKTNKVPLDFITTHHYGVDGYLDEHGVFQLVMPNNADGYPNAVSQTVSQTKNSSYPNIEIHFTEWSSSYSPRDPIHDTYQNATIVLNALRKVNPAPESMSYWTFTDIFEEPGTVNTPFHGGFGLMNIQGIKKPTYFAYKFLNELGHNELKNSDKDSWICSNDSGEVEALFWNLTMLDQQKTPNQIFYKRNLPPVKSYRTRLYIANLPSGEYMKEVYRIGYRQNDAYTAYLDMKAPDQLTLSQVKSLKEISNGAPVSKEIVLIENGIYDETFIVRENDVFFVKMKKI
jgi:xylan 1,4-beta-xylosidase